MSPFEVVYGYPPPKLLPYEAGTTRVQAVEEDLRSQDFILTLLRENLQDAQEMMKFFADKKRTDREFEVGESVYLQLRPYRQLTVAARQNLKLSPRYYGPFPILKRIGQAAYRLDLPQESLIFPVFLVSNLKKKLGDNTSVNPYLPLVTPDGTLTPEPEKLLHRKLKHKGNRAAMELLVQWKDTTEEETWMDWEELKKNFPHLEGKIF